MPTAFSQPIFKLRKQKMRVACAAVGHYVHKQKQRKADLAEGIYGLEWIDYTGYEEPEHPNRRWWGNPGISNSREPWQDKWGKECYEAQELGPWRKTDPWWATLLGAGYTKETLPLLTSTPSHPPPCTIPDSFFLPSRNFSARVSHWLNPGGNQGTQVPREGSLRPPGI